VDRPGNRSTDLRSGRTLAATGHPIDEVAAHGPTHPNEAPSTVSADPAIRRVVLVSGEPGTPGHRYRVDHVADAVRDLGHDALVCSVPDAASAHLGDVTSADVVLLWRAAWDTEVERIVYRARRAGAAIVFDVDDLLIDPGLVEDGSIDGIRSQGLSSTHIRDHVARLAVTAHHADACTTTTPALAEALDRFGHPVFELPNGFDADTAAQSRLARDRRDAAGDDGLVRLGYASGSLTHQRDVAVMAPAVATVLDRHPRTRLVVFRGSVDLDEFPAFAALSEQIEWRAMVPHPDLPDELARFDVNLAPLEVGNPFCEAKSDLKFFEAALVGVPTVASPTRPFVDAIEHGVNGFLAADTTAWTDALEALVADGGLRARVGTAAARDVQAPFGPERRRELVGELLDAVLTAHPTGGSLG